MHKRKLGKSAIEVSAVGMGCWAIGGPWTWQNPGEQPWPAGWGPIDDQESVRAIHAALVPGLSYEGLVIPDGGTAMRAYIDLAEEKDPERIAAIRNDLWENCKLDSLAMVGILEKLEEIQRAR